MTIMMVTVLIGLPESTVSIPFMTFSWILPVVCKSRTMGVPSVPALAIPILLAR